MREAIIKWLARILGVSLEPPFEIVDNLDIFVREKLNFMLADAESFDIATGYFQIAGWQAFAESVERLLGKGGRVRLLIGNVTQEYLFPQTAKFLLRLIKNPKIEARTVKPRMLHAKLFLVRTPGKLKLLFGSSNLTLGGMEGNIELNTYEVLDLTTQKARSFIEWFETLWNAAIPIDEELEFEITIAAQKEEPPVISLEDPNKALFLSLLARDLARVDLRDVGNFAPLKFQYMDAASGVNRYFFQSGDKRGLLLAHEVGLGKTIISGMIVKHLLYHKHIRNVLVVAPLSIVRQWKEDLRTKFNIESIEITGRTAANFKPEDFKVYLISYDLLRQRIPDIPHDWDFVIVDESHFIRNRETQRFKAVKTLNSKFFLLLTATPIHNKIEDIATQLSLFVPEEVLGRATRTEIMKVDRTKLFNAFVKRRLQKNELKEILPERKVLPPEIIQLTGAELAIYKKLQKFLSADSRYYQLISRSIEHIAPFIKQRYLEEFVSSRSAILFALNNLQERIEDARASGCIEYNFGALRKETEGSLADEINSFIEDELMAAANLEMSRDEMGNLIVRLFIDDKIKAELSADVEILRGIVSEIEKIGEFSKVRKVVERIKELAPSGSKKIVVFVGFIATGATLVKELKNLGIKAGFFYGDLEETAREGLLQKLRSVDDDRIDVLVSTDAAYVGLNLQIADTVIHHDFSWNPMVIEQRIGRIHRIGQKREITSYSFLCKGTIDERKHELLTTKLKEIATHLGMSYPVVLSEVAVSSEIEGLMARLELKEIDEAKLKQELERHIAERKEIFELLEELPSEEKEILQLGFTTDIIGKADEIIRELLKVGRGTTEFRVHDQIEDSQFMILDYKLDSGWKLELTTLDEKAILAVDRESLRRWQSKYKNDNFEPTYLTFYHPLIERIAGNIIKQNYRRFWKKKVSEGHEVVTFYLQVPVTVNNIAAKVSTNFPILVPVLYDGQTDEVRIDTKKVYELVERPGRVVALEDGDGDIIESARKKLEAKFSDIKGKIESDIKKITVEFEELARARALAEIEKEISESQKRLKNLLTAIDRKRNLGMSYDAEKRKYDAEVKRMEELQKSLEPSNIPAVLVEFGEEEIMGGCLYIR